MAVRTHSLFEREIIAQAVVDSFRKLNPLSLLRNPVMFVTEVGAAITAVVLFFRPGNESVGFVLQIALWLWFTVLFANFAEAMAEGRGKAQANALRKTRTKTMANHIRADGSIERIPAEQLRKGDLVWVSAGEIIPGDGEIIEGVATVDESAITGESAPVIREAGGDRSAVTGGTRVLSDRIKVRVTANPGESFLDRMIALVEGAQRQKTPNEIALTILLSAMTIIFLVVIITLKPFGIYSGMSFTITVLVALLVCLIPTTIGGLLSAIGIAGIDRMVQKNVLAMSGRAVEAAGDVDVLLLDKTGTITMGDRQATEFLPAPGVGVEELANAAQSGPGWQTMNTVGNKADTFLRMIRRAERGRLKVYLGYAAGVGKTYQMLLEGHRLQEEGIDVVVGLVETHGRVETEKLLEGLEIIPRRRQEYRGIVVEEMDVDAVLARKPQVALIDELAHTNVPGSRNDKRYQDVQDILSAGIHVITTLNIQHLESLYDTVEKAVAVKVRERLPDSVIAQADQIVNVDVSTEDLRGRLKEGKVYTPERIEVALDHFFKPSNLDKLRELTLRELASQIDLRSRDTAEEDKEDSASPDQVMACLSSRGPNSEKLLRYTSRLAGRLNRNWYAVYVQTPSEEPTVIDAGTQQVLSSTLTLAKQLGAIVFTYRGEDIVRTLLQFAKEYRVGHIVIGSPSPRSFWKKVRGRTGVVDRLIHEARGATVTVLDTREEEELKIHPPAESEEIPIAAPLPVEPASRMSLSNLITPERIVIWNKPVEKEMILKTLVEKAEQGKGVWESARFLNAILEREQQGSTFFNEGAAFPHARIDGLMGSMVSLGLVRQGVSDEPTEKPIELVFLILSPAQNPDEQIKILSLASRAAQNRHLRKNLQFCQTPEDVMAAIHNRDWEESSRDHSQTPPA